MKRIVRILFLGIIIALSSLTFAACDFGGGGGDNDNDTKKGPFAVTINVNGGDESCTVDVYDITRSTTAEEAIKVNPNDKVDDQTKLLIVVTAGGYYEAKSFTINGESQMGAFINNPYTNGALEYIVTNNTSINVEFGLIEDENPIEETFYTVYLNYGNSIEALENTVTITLNGETIESNTNVKNDSVLTISVVTELEGYEIQDLTINGTDRTSELLSNDGTITVTMTSDIHIYVLYKEVSTNPMRLFFEIKPDEFYYTPKNEYNDHDTYQWNFNSLTNLDYLLDFFKDNDYYQCSLMQTDQVSQNDSIVVSFNFDYLYSMTIIKDGIRNTLQFTEFKGLNLDDSIISFDETNGSNLYELSFMQNGYHLNYIDYSTEPQFDLTKANLKPGVYTLLVAYYASDDPQDIENKPSTSVYNTELMVTIFGDGSFELYDPDIFEERTSFRITYGGIKEGQGNMGVYLWDEYVEISNGEYLEKGTRIYAGVTPAPHHELAVFEVNGVDRLAEYLETNMVDITVNEDISIWIEILSPYSGLVFENKTVTFDGNYHSIEVQNAPSGAIIEYFTIEEGASSHAQSFKDVGEYEIWLTVKVEGYATTYLIATLTINESTDPMLMYFGITPDFFEAYENGAFRWRFDDTENLETILDYFNNNDFYHVSTPSKTETSHDAGILIYYALNNNNFIMSVTIYHGDGYQTELALMETKELNLTNNTISFNGTNGANVYTLEYYNHTTNTYSTWFSSYSLTPTFNLSSLNLKPALYTLFLVAHSTTNTSAPTAFNSTELGQTSLLARVLGDGTVELYDPEILEERDTVKVTFGSGFSSNQGYILVTNTSGSVSSGDMVKKGSSATIEIKPHSSYEIGVFEVNGIDKLSELQNGMIILSFHTDTTIYVEFLAYITGVVFIDKTVEYNTQYHTIEATNIPNGATAMYLIDGMFAPTDTILIKDIGEYEVTAIITLSGYAITYLNATLKIVENTDPIFNIFGIVPDHYYAYPLDDPQFIGGYYDWSFLDISNLDDMIKTLMEKGFIISSYTPKAQAPDPQSFDHIRANISGAKTSFDEVTDLSLTIYYADGTRTDFKFSKDEFFSLNNGVITWEEEFGTQNSVGVRVKNNYIYYNNDAPNSFDIKSLNLPQGVYVFEVILRIPSTIVSEHYILIEIDSKGSISPFAYSTPQDSDALTVTFGTNDLGDITITNASDSLTSNDTVSKNSIIVISLSEHQYTQLKFLLIDGIDKKDLLVNNSLTLQVTQSLNIIAIFEYVEKYEITINYSKDEDIGGEIIVKDGDKILQSGDLVYKGTVLTITVITENGYKLESFNIDSINRLNDLDQNNSLTVTVTNSIRFYAAFIPPILGIVFEDREVPYIAQYYSMEIDNLPSHISVTYSIDGLIGPSSNMHLKDVGVYEVIAELKATGYATTYLTATLTIVENTDPVFNFFGLSPSLYSSYPQGHSQYPNGYHSWTFYDLTIVDGMVENLLNKGFYLSHYNFVNQTSSSTNYISATISKAITDVSSITEASFTVHHSDGTYTEFKFKKDDYYSLNNGILSWQAPSDPTDTTYAYVFASNLIVYYQKETSTSFDLTTLGLPQGIYKFRVTVLSAQHDIMLEVDTSGNISLYHYSTPQASDDISVTFGSNPLGNIKVTNSSGSLTSGDVVNKNSPITITLTEQQYTQIKLLIINGVDKTSSLSNNSLTIQVSESLHIIAIFEPKSTHSISISMNSAQGSILVKDGERIINDGDYVNLGTQLTIQVIESLGYELNSFKINYEERIAELDSNNTIQITVLQNISLSAYCLKLFEDITFESKQVAYTGQNIPITISGTVPSDTTVKYVLQGGGTSYSSINVKELGDHVITVTISRSGYKTLVLTATITVINSNDPNLMFFGVTPDKGFTYEVGTSIKWEFEGIKDLEPILDFFNDNDYFCYSINFDGASPKNTIIISSINASEEKTDLEVKVNYDNGFGHTLKFKKIDALSITDNLLSWASVSGANLYEISLINGNNKLNNEFDYVSTTNNFNLNSLNAKPGTYLITLDAYNSTDLNNITTSPRTLISSVSFLVELNGDKSVTIYEIDINSRYNTYKVTFGGGFDQAQGSVTITNADGTVLNGDRVAKGSTITITVTASFNHSFKLIEVNGVKNYLENNSVQITITKNTAIWVEFYDPITEVVFNDKTVVYDTNFHSLTIENLPSDISVQYSAKLQDGTDCSTVVKDMGVYIITAKLFKTGYAQTYLTATLTIVENTDPIFSFFGFAPSSYVAYPIDDPIFPGGYHEWSFNDISILDGMIDNLINQGFYLTRYDARYQALDPQNRDFISARVQGLKTSANAINEASITIYYSDGTRADFNFSKDNFFSLNNTVLSWEASSYPDPVCNFYIYVNDIQIYYENISNNTSFDLATLALPQGVYRLDIHTYSDQQAASITKNIMLEIDSNGNISLYHYSTPQASDDITVTFDANILGSIDVTKAASNGLEIDGELVIPPSPGGPLTSGDVVNKNAKITITLTNQQYTELKKLIINGIDKTSSVTNNSLTLTVTESLHIIAIFGYVEKYTITIAAIDPTQGSIIVKDGDRVINSNDQVYKGTVLTVTFTTIGDYEIVGFYIEGGINLKDSIQNNSIQVTITKAANLLTHFKPVFKGITFDDATLTYTGQDIPVTINGTLPTGARVTYSGNGLSGVTNIYVKEIGQYNFTATITCTGYDTLILTATITVTNNS